MATKATKMDINDTKRMLEQVRTYDHRELTDQLAADWQRALLRITVEQAFDAIHGHYERCNDAARVPLTPIEILRHVQQQTEQAAADEHRRRANEANEMLFGSLSDHRTEQQRAAALDAMRAGRGQLESVLAARRDAKSAAGERIEETA